MSEKIVLMDGHSILNRAFYGVPELTNSEGLHTNAVYGFLNILFKILEEEKPEYLTVAFDVKEPTFRHEMYADYKGTRKPMPAELHEQVPIMKDVLKAMGVAVVERPGYEADDILGTIAKRSEAQGMEVSLVSGDRDLLQIASDHICVRIPKTKKGTTTIENYYAADVKALYQVTPEEFIDVKALMGDSSDNIPGVPSIGEKTATLIISQYKSIENAYAHVDEIKPARAQNALREHYDMAQMSKTLAAIKTDCELPCELEDARIGNLFTKEAFEMMKRLEFKSLLARFDTVETGVNERQETERFQLIEGLAEAEEFFDQTRTFCGGNEAKTGAVLGFKLIAEGDVLLGVSLAAGNKHCALIKCGGFLTEEYLLDAVRSLMRLPAAKVTIGLKEQLFLLGDMEGAPEIRDAGIAAYLLNPLKDTYDYDDIAKDYMGLLVPARTDLLEKSSLVRAAEEKEEEFLKYCCYFAFVAAGSMDVLMAKLGESGMDKLYLTVEMPLVYSLYHMEREGIRLDRGALKEYGDKLAVRIEQLEKEIYESAGGVFNINSPKQLGEVLFDRLKLPHAKKTKTGYSTAADVLEKLKPEHPVIDMILEYRQLTKLKSTYADGLDNYIGADGRIHGKFHQTITATGRISSTEPNLQNIPVRMELGRAIRKVFVPADGHVFLDADYSQIELRVLAHMSGDERLIEAYKQAQDIHAITASQVFHIPLDEVTPLQRRNAKAVNFGIVYGISAFGLSEGLSISRKEATEYIEQYFKTYPKVKEFLDSLVAEGKEKGYVTTMFGRIRPIPELKSSNFMQRQFGERVAMNSPIQGTAADIIKIAMNRVDARLEREKLESKIVLQVHDELLIEVKAEELAQVKAILSEEMRGAADLAVPLEIGMETGDNWFATK